MRKTPLYFAVVMLLFAMFCQNMNAAETIPSEGQAFPDLALPVPEKANEREYLGLEGKGTFRIKQIKADLVIIEIFSMYCPYCQKEAPIVNDLYQIINKREDLREKIKIVGIGAGNTPFEVDVFRTQYDIPFPLLSDESFTVHKAVGEVRTPHFFVMKINTDGTDKIIYSKVGSMKDPQQLLEHIVKKSELK